MSATEDPTPRPLVPVVELSFAALPEHVRTARLVAVAVARRVGLDDDRLDEVRLAVGEACARAVRLMQGSAARPDGRSGGTGDGDEPGTSVVRVLIDDRDGLLVRVEGPSVGLDTDPVAGTAGASGSADEMALAVVHGLVPGLTTERDAMTLHWAVV